MWKKAVLALSLAALFMAGCGNDGGHDQHTDQPGDAMHGDHGGSNADGTIPDLIKVELNVPEEVKAKEPIIISARVTQSDKAVDDADKVEFEYWMEGEEHERAEGTLKEDGTYQMEHTFEKPGTYNVISHVTARDMHSMPKKTFEVK
ncbi:FixH family protein [Paenibacillus sp. MER TA 81-3]|uniref:FixH family protein n=1 Tax=Paenibacillus sp. MER TA 81-3 TaxID=2939573 RepID=UPI00203E06DB|nr:FixH family protein [Paenibacillus sp. MER TA 81-3]MCM3339937.1 FixH family protein [Paenibacillus sp. MER TA 81-3]